ncbi:ATP-dependent endonuclease [Thalassoglobus sp.]|uniref:ATP-dependent endonuclease n=1 Tax=Thalassoglobus sp. TaxID=2795869 RepID=UPI003AA9C9F2
MSEPHNTSLPVLILLEGPHDVEFLRRISRVLAEVDPAVPSLATLEQSHEIAILPLGGNGPQPWMQRLTPLCRSAFSLFDREMPPESEQRRLAIDNLNSLPKHRSFMTGKRSLENYLHPQAISDARNVSVNFGDDDDVAELAALEILRSKRIQREWTSLSLRTRKRLRNQAKHWLNRDVVDCMTPQRLADSDHAGEVTSWLHAIAELVNQ